ncbi:AAA family ATPase [Shewanella sp. 0m-8]
MNNSLFITNIALKNHTFIQDINIYVDSSEKRNLIITGKNGSGKTTLLKTIAHQLNALRNSHYSYAELYSDIESNRANIQRCRKEIQELKLNTPHDAVRNAQLSNEIERFTNQIDDTKKIINNEYDNIHISFNNSDKDYLKKHKFLIATFEARRKTVVNKVLNISSPIAPKVSFEESASDYFLQYLVNRKSQQAFAYSDGETREAEEIGEWLTSLEEYFSLLFERELKLKFNRQELLFTMQDQSGNELDFNTLSDGYSSVIEVVTDIIMRMEENQFGNYNQNGIVLIDEVETHLHVSLQKSILPFLTKVFPNIQFIVTTHSPFVLSSVDDAVIYDMEMKQRISQEDNLWAYSYEALVEGYFEIEKFSTILKKKITQFEQLSALSDDKRSREDRKLLRQLKKELENVPLFKNPAIEAKLKSLGLK